MYTYVEKSSSCCFLYFGILFGSIFSVSSIANAQDVWITSDNIEDNYLMSETVWKSPQGEQYKVSIKQVYKHGDVEIDNLRFSKNGANWQWQRNTKWNDMIPGSTMEAALVWLRNNM